VTTPAQPAVDVELGLLARRARDLARPLDDQQDRSNLDLLLVAVGEQQVALAVEDVRGVRPPGAVSHVPGGQGALVGLAGGHGDALAVAALSHLLALPGTRPAHEQWVVVLEHPSAPLGLLVDAALDIVSVHETELRPPSDPGVLIRALLPQGALVLDTPALLRDPRLSLRATDPAEETPWPHA
jgi:purine-binding chemotaxis protein CheW